MSDGIGKIPPSSGKPLIPEPDNSKKAPAPEQPTENIMGMMMTKKQKKMFVSMLIKSISDDFNVWAKKALEAIKRLGKKSRGEE